MKQIALLASLFVLHTACVKRAPNCCAMPPLEMIRTQTQCADPWGYGNTNPETIEKLKSYLAKKDITVTNIELQSTGESNVCTACTCSNGFSFHVWADQRYKDTLTREGFVIR